jgi:hypothetical protein
MWKRGETMDDYLDAQSVMSILSNRFQAELLIRVAGLSNDADGLYRVVGAEVSGKRVVLQIDEVPVGE